MNIRSSWCKLISLASKALYKKFYITSHKTLPSFNSKSMPTSPVENALGISIGPMYPITVNHTWLDSDFLRRDKSESHKVCAVHSRGSSSLVGVEVPPIKTSTSNSNGRGPACSDGHYYFFSSSISSTKLVSFAKGCGTLHVYVCDLFHVFCLLFLHTSIPLWLGFFVATFRC